MDDARALLNSLMGNDRNERAEQRKVRSFTDADICKNFLLGLCPNDLFKNTKMDLGACDKDHNDVMKDQFEADSNKDRYARKWRRGLIAQCRRSLLDVDRRIALNRDRIAREKDVTFGASDEAKLQLAALKEEVAEKLRAAERAADAGKFDESREIIKASEVTKRKIEDFEMKRFEKYKKDSICDICGLIVDGEEIEAMKTGRGWHSNGRQHIGYGAIREKLKELEDAQAEDRRHGIPSPSTSPAPEKASDRDAKRRKSASRSRRGKSKETRRRPDDRKRSRSRGKGKSADARKRSAEPRRRSMSRSRSKGKRKDGRRRGSPSPRRSRSRRRDRSRRRRSRSRSRKKDSRSPDRKKTKKPSPKRRSPSSNEARAKSKKVSKEEKTPKPDVIERMDPVKVVAEPPPRTPSPQPAPPPEPVVEPPKPPEVKEDIDAVRPRVAFFMGLKPVL